MGTRCDAMTFGALKHSRAGSLFGVLLEAIFYFLDIIVPEPKRL